MSVNPAADGHQPAWWGVDVEHLGLARTTTMMLKQTGILRCQDFCDWSRAELGGWAAENGVNPVPIILVLTRHGIPLAPNDRPDRLVRLVLAPANQSSREAVIEYYGLLGHRPRTLKEFGADSPIEQRVLARRLAEATPRLDRLKRLVPQLALTLTTGGAHPKRESTQLALAIAPLLGEGQTPPVHFARLLLDALRPRHAGPPVAFSKSASARNKRANSTRQSQQENVNSRPAPKRDKSVRVSDTKAPGSQAIAPLGQRAERSRAAGDLIGLLFGDDEG